MSSIIRAVVNSEPTPSRFIVDVFPADVRAASKSHRLLDTQRTKKKQLQDLIDELLIDLINKEAENEAEKAKSTALEEHAILHRVTAMWLGLGVKNIFDEWKAWVQQRVSQVKI